MTVAEALSKITEFIFRITGPKNPLREAIRVLTEELNKHNS